jgi:predicted nucleotidyltransferase
MDKPMTPRAPRDIPTQVRRDIERIKKTFGGRLGRIAVFGSILTKPFDDTNDVDIALFLTDADVPACIALLQSLDLSLPIAAQRINSSYRSKPTRVAGQRDYHIVVLDDDHPNETFMAISGRELLFL